MDDVRNNTLAELEAGLGWISQAPKDSGRLELIVRRPGVDQREALDEATLDLRLGLVGDTWNSRRSSRTGDGSPHPDMQVTLMSARVIGLLAGAKEHWPLAGDQLFVDLDLSVANLPPGSRLQIGAAVVEVTAQPHTGCAKFAARFGHDALLFVNAPARKELRLRGVNAKVIQPGVIQAGDPVKIIRKPGG